MLNQSIIILGKLASKIVKKLRLGHGSTWPGHVALRLNPHFVRDIVKNSPIPIILIAGTNGKTTSSLMLRTILEENGKKVIHNDSGANLLNGLASIILMNSSILGRLQADYLVFEVDENALPQVVKETNSTYILLLNLFRDQLDRYGEVTTIAEKWQKAFLTLPETTTIIANADDPKVAFLGMQKKNSVFFGIGQSNKEKKTQQEVSDSTYCPQCYHQLSYHYRTYSHLGDWYCSNCKLKRPTINASKNINISLSGTYNLYNAHGIIVLSHKLGTPDTVTAKALAHVPAAFGRQEKILVKGKKIQVFLSKNPTGFNESLRTISEQHGKHVMLVINDHIADGTDVSWIWDIDIESYLPYLTTLTVSGARAYDMGLRIMYATDEQKANSKWQIEENLNTAIEEALTSLPKDETLYILPTYTAMLEVRKILTGRKIL